MNAVEMIARSARYQRPTPFRPGIDEGVRCCCVWGENVACDCMESTCHCTHGPGIAVHVLLAERWRGTRVFGFYLPTPEP
jgi:hypothetical protein